MKNIVIASPNFNSISETFIENHRRQIKGNIFYLYRGYYPTKSEDGQYDLPFHKYTLKEKLGKRFGIKRNPLEKYLYENRIELVIAEYGPTGVEMMPVCKKLSIPMIVFIRGYDITSKETLDNYSGKYKDLFNFCSCINASSKSLANMVLKYEVDPDKIIVNPSGAREEFFNIEPDYRSNNIISIGRLVDKKAPYLTLAAFKYAQERYPELTLSIIGEGPLLNTCYNLAEVWGLNEKVKFTGPKNHDFIHNELSKSFCYIQHSITAMDGNMEGTPVSILEASASALPVISTLHAGIPEAVLHNETGFLVEEKDIYKMSEYLVEIHEHRNRAREMGEKGRQHILNNYTVSKHIEIVNELIRNV